MSQKFPEKPGRHAHVPSPATGTLVVVQLPPFWHGLTEQNGALTAHVGPEKLGKQLHKSWLVAVLNVHVPLF